MKKWIIGLLILGILLGSCLLCLKEYGSPNPFATALGLLRVCVLDRDYAQLRLDGRSYLGNSKGGMDLFLDTMEVWGYRHLPDEQMGSVHLFQAPDGSLVRVRFLINAYYAKWIWY